jgi:3-methyladenine DNA glycosylase/8-oxoguanine DNA glycosylase
MSSSSPASEAHSVAPAGFDFWRTVRSHGWCSLPPFSHNSREHTLSRTLTLPSGRVVNAGANSSGNTIVVSVSGKATSEDLHAAMQAMRSCLRLDEDFSAFHHACRRVPRFRWIAAAGAGRMLRSPSVFEDAVKLICTTNCSWDLTTVMARNLVTAFGKPSAEGDHDFPSPNALAATTERILRRDIRAGYRAPFLLEFADRVASGKLDVESWRTSRASTPELFAEMRKVRGVGPYTAGNLLKLIGRYDHLALDSWCRSRYFQLRHRGRKVKDATIEKEYRRFGEWRGLLFWLEMTREWHEGSFPL